MGSSHPPILWARGSFPKGRQPESKFLRLGMSGAIPPLPLCAYKAWTAKTLPFTSISNQL